MAKPTPATIEYTTKDGAVQVIRFHTVISEGHDAKNVITSYPVQDGFNISQHSVRQNRKVAIEGIFTNSLLEGSGMVEYSRTNNSKEMFKVLQSLVQSSTVCKVVTNLGVYHPVVFVAFQTTQKEGMVDSMQFSISGEEVQIASVVAATLPRPLDFKILSSAEKQNLGKLWEDSGLKLVDEMIVSKATHTLGKDFMVETNDISGESFNVHYVAKNYDDLSKTYTYEQSSDALLSEKASEAISGGFTIAGYETPTITEESIIKYSTDLAIGFTGCVIGGAVDLATGYVRKTIDDAVDSVTDEILNLIKIGGTILSNPLAGMAANCLIASVDDLVTNGATDDPLEKVERYKDSIKQKGIDFKNNTMKLTNVDLVKIEAAVPKALSNTVNSIRYAVGVK